MANRKNYLDLYVWAEKEGGLYGSWHYAMTFGDSFKGGGSTPTISTYKDFWEDVVKHCKESLSCNQLEECCLHVGKVPNLEEWSKTDAKAIPIEAHNYLLLKLPLNNFPALPGKRKEIFD